MLSLPRKTSALLCTGASGALEMGRRREVFAALVDRDRKSEAGLMVPRQGSIDTELECEFRIYSISVLQRKPSHIPGWDQFNI